MADKILWDVNGDLTETVTIEHGQITRSVHQDLSRWDKEISLVRDLKPGGYGETKDLKHIASIPVTLYQQWCDEVGFDIQKDPKKFREKLNSADFSAVRVGGGRV